MTLNEKYDGITDEKIDLWEQIFFDVHEKDNYKNFDACIENYRRNKIVEDNDVMEYDFNKSIVRKKYDDTICENIDYFKQMLQLIKEVWPEAKIILLHMPLYELAIERSEELFGTWKKEFDEIIDGLKQDIIFEYVDYTKHDISKDKCYWYDFEHLNYCGAVKFTQEINKLL